jgi:hypothetical protein
LVADVGADKGSLLSDVFYHTYGTFFVKVNGRNLLREKSFCVVEFAIDSRSWLQKAKRSSEDFVYESFDAEGQLLWIRKANCDWKVGSDNQLYDEPTEFSLSEIERALKEYFDALRKDILDRFSVDIETLSDWSKDNAR